MNDSTPTMRGYLLAGLVGALGGGLLVAVATRALPKIVSQVMAEMMSKMPPLMMQRMQEAGFNPAEMCQQMAQMFAEASPATATQASEPGGAHDES